ncbi:FtsH protease activity modulator HflK [Phaeobacter sp. HF9A]|uniref:FtsH protease activity modulator HflK n=1 Tax=Phaeobacter sp. HF9A TaxID=2721561 RepID=UPI0014308954|nr:FtsH protease activity modulator HflK [Phaeobacter sp. HF9A]NIZ14181.1 FtsH protease activity modulator HflK [Phaeobacter sp. HF9A]
MAGNSGGPWGGGGSSGGGGNRGNDGDKGGGRRPEDGQIPEIDELMKKGQEQLRVLIGGRGGKGGGQGPSGSGGGGGPMFSRGGIALGALAAVGLWLYSSFYTVKPEEQGVELFLGSYYRTTDDGPHMAWWPFIKAEVIATTTEQTENIGAGGRGSDAGLMLTGDENIVDIDFQVVWNINEPANYLFNLRDPKQTIQAVSESAMREIIAQSELAPILNRDREIIATRLQELIQSTLDTYDAGINIVRVNFDGADPPEPVKDAFREVQSAGQERDKLEKQADAYANRKLAGARGQAAQTLEEAEAYRAQVVNEAQGEASRFLSVLAEYDKAPEVTRKRLYLETMEKVLGNVDKIILDGSAGGVDGQGVVPYLPLNEIRRSGGSN